MEVICKTWKTYWPQSEEERSIKFLNHCPRQNFIDKTVTTTGTSLLNTEIQLRDQVFIEATSLLFPVNSPEEKKDIQILKIQKQTFPGVLKKGDILFFNHTDHCILY